MIYGLMLNYFLIAGLVDVRVEHAFLQGFTIGMRVKQTVDKKCERIA